MVINAANKSYWNLRQCLDQASGIWHLTGRFRSFTTGQAGECFITSEVELLSRLHSTLDFHEITHKTTKQQEQKADTEWWIPRNSFALIHRSMHGATAHFDPPANDNSTVKQFFQRSHNED